MGASTTPPSLTFTVLCLRVSLTRFFLFLTMYAYIRLMVHEGSFSASFSTLETGCLKNERQSSEYGL